MKCAVEVVNTFPANFWTSVVVTHTDKLHLILHEN